MEHQVMDFDAKAYAYCACQNMVSHKKENEAHCLPQKELLKALLFLFSPC
jgi:hypothetical protein